VQAPPGAPASHPQPSPPRHLSIPPRPDPPPPGSPPPSPTPPSATQAATPLDPAAAPLPPQPLSRLTRLPPLLSLIPYPIDRCCALPGTTDRPTLHFIYCKYLKDHCPARHRHPCPHPEHHRRPSPHNAQPQRPHHARPCLHASPNPYWSTSSGTRLLHWCTPTVGCQSTILSSWLVTPEAHTRRSPVPTSIRNTLIDSHWRHAMEEEYKALQSNNT
jgi:hypothetical protein